MLTLEQSINSYLSINVDSPYPSWDNTTSFAFATTVYFENYHYKSVIENNQGNTPSLSPLYWLKIESSNTYSAIDLKSKTKTICDSTTKTGGNAPYDLIMEFETSRYDAISLGNVRGTDIIIEVFETGDYVNAVETITQKIETRYTVDSWFNYFYSPLIPDLTEFERNFYFRIKAVTGKIRVTITEGYGAYSSVSYMLSGKTEYIADTLFNVGMSLTDYSKTDTDEFGVTEVQKRDVRESLDINIQFDSKRINHVRRSIKRKQGEILLFIVDESIDSAYENLQILGYIEDYNTVLSNAIQTQASITVSENL